MSEHKKNDAKPASSVDVSNIDEGEAKILAERYQNAHPGFFLRAATWLLSRFALTKHRYQNWSPTKRIVIGWLCWIVVLPIIPIVAILLWYFHDPEGFKKSAWAKALIGLAVLWAGYAGVVITSPSQADVNGKYSPIQTAPNGEVSGKADSVNTASAAAKEKVASQKESKASDGRQFKNCTEAFEAGVFNIKRSDASYQSKLDRDSDGIACEK
jgi:hypothetical protein